ncbi:MAG: hypothetical protein E7480_08260 [Ruminococcaceae bacterium]|nr:hypothetical protein [Oscillospiraceae bacterium]
MKKRILLILLAAVLVLSAAACTKPAEKTNSDISSDIASLDSSAVDSSSSENVLSSEGKSEESSSNPSSSQPASSNAASSQPTQTPSNSNEEKLLIGAFCGIDPNYADEQHIKEAAEAGIHMLFIDAELRNAALLKMINQWCEKYGIKWLLTDPSLYGVGGHFNDIANITKNYASLSAFAGNIIRDEPGADQFDVLGNAISLYKKALPGKLGFINLLPTYANSTTQLNAPNYQSYVDQYVAKVPTDYICVDFYPCTRLSDDTKTTLAGYCDNLDIVSTAARKSGREFWSFIQTTTWSDGHRLPDETDIRWQMYTNLAFGATAMFHFTYSTPTGGGGESFKYAMIDKSGKKTDIYYAAQKVDAEFNAFSSVYMKYKSLGAFSHNSASASSYLTFKNQYKGFSTIKSVNCAEPLLIGCYESKTGSSKAFTVVNMSELSLNKSTTVTLELANAKKVTSYQGGKAKVLTGNAGKYTINLACGEGAFVTVE